jgi:hypothetical protein
MAKEREALEFCS